MTYIHYLHIEPIEKGTHTNKCMTFFPKGFFKRRPCICRIKEIFYLVISFLSLLLNKFLQSEIMQKSRSVQNITNIVAVADEYSGAVCMFVVLCSA